jgi:hypothetical protein
MTRDLLALADYLEALGVTHVALESTWGYSLQANRKTKEGQDHPARVDRGSMRRVTGRVDRAACAARHAVAGLVDGRSHGQGRGSCVARRGRR